MRRKTSIICSALALLLCVLLGGCAMPAPQEGETLPQEDATYQQDAQPEAAELQQILPVVEEAMVEQRTVRLYYRMQGESLLAQETRTLMFPKDKQTERVLAEALLGGPSPNLLELTGLFPSGAKIYSVLRTNDLLTIVLSKEFLSTPTGVPADWENDPVWSDEVYTRRTLALASIVNTITEATDYTAVQFLVQQNDDDTVGRRLRMNELRADAPFDQLLAPMQRSEHLLLTHFNTAGIIMDCWREQTYERLYRFVAQESAQRPTDSAFVDIVRSLNRPLVYHSLTAGTVSADGKCAVLEASYEYKTDRGSVQIQSFPMKLVRENGIWKITYEELIRMMGAL